MKRFVLLLIIVFFCNKNLIADNTDEYIHKYRKVAIKEMKKYGIPASITLAQGILESGSGNSRLAKKARNHFGIKCTSDWNGKKIKEDDDKKDECFRKYRKAEQSYRDHSEFLTKRDRYKTLFDIDRKDYKAWAYGLKSAGYATNPNYPNLLIDLIEKYNLDKYDKRGASKVIKQEDNKKENVVKSNEVENQNLYEVKKGDTLYSISKKYNLSIVEIKRLNGKKNNDLYLGEKLKVK